MPIKNWLIRVEYRVIYILMYQDCALIEHKALESGKL